MAHASMLAKQGIIEEQEKEEILKGLKSILEDIENKLEVIFIAAYLITEYNLMCKDHYYLRWYML